MTNYDNFLLRHLVDIFVLELHDSQRATKPIIFAKIEVNWKIVHRMAVPEVIAQLNKIGTRKPKPDGTKVKIRVFANLGENSHFCEFGGERIKDSLPKAKLRHILR